jgi:FtsH-binding integral membrane protein
VLLFSGFFLYRFFNLSKSENTWEAAVAHTLSIYITFVNFFINLLQLLLAIKKR